MSRDTDVTGIYSKYVLFKVICASVPTNQVSVLPASQKRRARGTVAVHAGTGDSSGRLSCAR